MTAGNLINPRNLTPFWVHGTLEHFTVNAEINGTVETAGWDIGNSALNVLPSFNL